MGNQERKVGNDMRTAFSRLRDVTRIMKVAPFVYAVILIVIAFLYVLCNEETLYIIDKTFYVSPLVVMLFFMLSYKLKFCNWYRLQCSLPLIPQSVVYIDSYVYEFSENVTYLSLAFFGLIFLVSLINTYFVFIKRAG